jgi:hypothetical protein
MKLGEDGKKSRSMQNRALVLGALLLVAGGIAAAVVFVGTQEGKPLAKEHPGKVVDVSKVPKSIKLSTDAATLAKNFIATNVVRKNLADGYKLVGPDLKEGLTRKEWMSGNIPIVPYPAEVIDEIPIQVIYSHPREAVLRVFLLPKKGAKIRAGTFWLKLEKFGTGKDAHWLVNGWTPYLPTTVPNGRS